MEKSNVKNELRLEAMYQLSLMTGQSDHHILNYALDAIVSITASKIGYIYFVNADETKLTLFAWSEGVLEECSVAGRPTKYNVSETGLWGEAVRQRKAIITNDYASSLWKKGLPSGHVPISKHLNVPVFSSDRIILVAGVGNKTDDYDETDIQLVSIIVSEAWRIIQQNRALTEELLNKQRFESLYKMTQMHDKPIDEINRFALEEAVRLTASKVGYLHFIDPDQENIHLYLWSGKVKDECQASTGLHYPLESAGIWADSVRNQKPVIHNDYPNEPGKKGYPEGHFPVSRHMSVPLFQEGKIVSVLGVGNKEQEYTDFDVLQLQIFLDGLSKITQQRQARQQITAGQEALAESEKKIRALVDNLQEGIWEIDKDAVTTFVNPMMGKMLGYTPEEMLGKDLFFFMDEKGRTICNENLERRKQGISETHDFEFIHKNGSKVYAAISTNPITNTQGEYMGALAAVTDTSERKKTEENIRHLAKFPSENPNPVMRVAPNGELLYANASSQPLLDAWFIAPGDFLPDHVFAFGNKALQEQQSISELLAVKNRIYTLTFHPVGEAEYLNIYGQDITERKQTEEELQVIRERLEMSLSASELGMWDFNVKTGNALFDENWLGMVGYAPGELEETYATWERMLHPDDKEKVFEILQRHLDDKEGIYIAEFRLKTKTQEWKWIQTTGKVVERDRNGSPERMIGVHQDISARKQHEEELEQNLAIQGALSRLYEILIESNTTIVDVSKALYEESRALTGAKFALCATVNEETGTLVAHTFDKLQEKDCNVEIWHKDCFSHNQTGEHQGLLGYSLTIGTPFYTNKPQMHKAAKGLPDGHITINQFMAVPVILGERRAGLIALANKPEGFNSKDLICIGEMARYYGLAIQGMEAQTKLEDSEERYRSLVESMQEGIIMVDASGRLTFMNHQICKMLGRARTDLLGKDLVEFVTPNDREFYLEQLDKRSQGNSDKYELAFDNNEGKKVFTLVSPTPLFDDAGEFNGAFGVVTNITQLKILESQLLQAQKLESIGQLAAGIAHEINTPTQYVDNNIRFLQEGMSELVDFAAKSQKLIESVKKGEEDALAELEALLFSHNFQLLLEEAPEALADSLEGLNRIAKIVNSVKQLAHPGQQGKEYVDINEAVKSTVTVSTNEWKYVADLELELDEDLPNIPGIRGELNQVFLNLIINSAHSIQDKINKTSGGKGKITISTKKLEEYVQIRVQDTGMGIPDEVAQKIFDPFFTTKEVGRGTGQGLAISWTVIVEKHGGELSFTSREGEGAEFEIKLPISDKGL